MRICPRCRDEYEDDVATCVHCGIDTFPEGADLPPTVDRLLGTFHPLVVERVVGLLTHRDIAHDLVAEGDRVEVIVDRDHRDAVRAELAAHWPEVVRGLDPEDHLALAQARTPQLGWFDPPTSAWVDREGRLQVDTGPDDEATAEASRLWGPTMVTLGGVLLLFGWYSAGSAQIAVIGGVMVLVGLFLPR